METKQPTKEQIKELWEWCGFQEKAYKEYVHGYLMHGGKQYEKAWFAPNGDNWLENLPPIDLNNLFKHAVPKLQFYAIDYRIKEKDVYSGVIYQDRYTYAYDKDPALALFWAIWEVIHESK